jgi:hypothetical protein
MAEGTGPFHRHVQPLRLVPREQFLFPVLGVPPCSLQGMHDVPGDSHSALSRPNSYGEWPPDSDRVARCGHPTILERTGAPGHGRDHHLGADEAKRYAGPHNGAHNAHPARSRRRDRLALNPLVHGRCRLLRRSGLFSWLEALCP